MAPSSTFHAFPTLPQEIQARIWQAFILETNKERLVMLDEETREIIPTRFLAYSVFCVNFLSRSVFMKLYPAKIPVYRTYTSATFKDDYFDDDVKSLDYDYTVGDEDDADSVTSSQVSFEFSSYIGEPRGHLYVNFSRDIFIVSGIRRFQFDFNEDRFCPPNYDITTNHKTVPLNVNKCRSMKHLMEVTKFQRWRAMKPIPPIRHLAKLNKHEYEKKVFSGVETCQHLYSFWDTMDLGGEEFDIQKDLLTLPGHELLDKWARETVLYSKKMLYRAFDGK
ncbi:hypothetical protein F5Y13DRAFT_94324 [Hypoxylon sp. FL1857]|nr:hypothetical protein F5Y13DRAFT_94324 [Hypoxylon sp. FL1857]